ncbi:hypothetical protein EV192_113281 [Actinocrispum wychmicini]|uniref:Uncharacterized protein n=1 Tax=Actinocrispum wychmicini TaxID=1213861 RepID=A0A4R2J245_9PSEU|nr:hypothetical protein EV192_113281 [Actinocrispum wychmicini]
MLQQTQDSEELGVTRVVMESTSDCGKPVFSLLEAHGFET